MLIGVIHERRDRLFIYGGLLSRWNVYFPLPAEKYEYNQIKLARGNCILYLIWNIINFLPTSIKECSRYGVVYK